jgi:hypothetical protein
MIAEINKLKAGITTESFYKYIFTDIKFMTIVKKHIYDILVTYGKIATASKDSLSNMDNIHVEVDIESGELSVDVHWGKSKSTQAYFKTLINKIRFGDKSDLSIQKLEEYVRGKREFFRKHSYMLKAGAYPYRTGLATDNEYARALKSKIEKVGNLGGKFVYRGQHAKANNNDIIKATYSKHKVDFYQAIEIDVNSLLREQYNAINIDTMRAYNLHNAGDIEYVCVYSNTGIGYIQLSLLTDNQRKIIKAMITGNIEYTTADEMISSVISYANKRAKALYMKSRHIYKDATKGINIGENATVSSIRNSILSQKSSVQKDIELLAKELLK